ncbi:hypothetical protein V6N13_070620 [Hibiscus sabdariffa]
MKVPVDSGPGRITLFNKHDVFIADDLQLKDLFIQSSSRPLFVWYPQPCLPLLSQTVLFELYSKIGVRSSLNMEANKRHEAVQSLLKLIVLETSETVTVKMDESAEQKDQLLYATYFSETIAAGLLWEKEDLISSLSELITMAYILKFDADAVGFMMKSKNLQLFVEDEEFLSAVFPNE